MSRSSDHIPYLPANSYCSRADDPTLAFGESEHRFLAAIVNASEDAILSKTLEGIITSWNPAAERLFGYAAGEIIGKPKTILFPPERLQEEQMILDRLRQGISTDHFETVRLHQDGTPIHVSVTISPIKDEDGKVIGASTIARDITGRKHNEERLHEVTIQRQAILDSADYSIISTNVQGTILSFNRAAERMLGYRAEEVVGKVTPAIIHDADEVVARAERLTLELGRSIAPGFEVLVAKTWDGTPDENEWTYIRKDGSRFPVRLSVTALRDEAGALTGYLGIAQDITTRKQAEQAPRDSEARFYSFINQGSLYAWITDSEGVIEYLNEPYCAMIGRTLQECVGKTPFDLYPAEAAQVLLDNIRQVARTGEVLETVEMAPLPDGKQHYFLVHKFLLREVNGRVLVGGSAIDITERKEAEQSLRKSQEQLTLAQKVARMGSWEYDLATGKIVWSPEMFRLLNVAPEQGEPDYATNLALYHSNDAARLDACVRQAVAEGKDYELDLRQATQNGQPTRWYHAIGKAEQNETGQVVRLFGTVTDITQHKAIAEVIRQSQKSLNHAQAIAHVGSWEHDYRTETMVWSEELFRLCGLEPSTDMPGIQTLYSYIHPLDRQQTQALMQQAMCDGIGADHELRLVGADGVLRYVHLRTEILKEEMGQPIGSHGTLLDVTERVKALQEQAKFVSLIENSSDFIAMASLDGVLLTMNPAGRKLVGLERVEEVTTTLLPDFMPAEVWNCVRHDVLPVVMRDDLWQGECQLVNVTSGQVYDMQASFFLIRNPVSGEPMCIATVQHDITKQKWMDAQLQQNLVLVQEQNVQLEWQQQELASANAHLEALATTDGLTGAKNHRAFQEKLSEEFNRTERTYCSFSVILLDVDKFKQYNDSFGHPEGDHVLKQVVRVLQEKARETDFVARYGGEEFVVLLPETSTEGAVEAAERFRTALEAHEWPLRPVTASFGVASLCTETTTAQQLIDMADRALYASKEGGRNRVTHAETLSNAMLSRSLNQ